MPGPADLDELIVRCRNESAREHFREAVDAYRAGAYRAAIVSTWVATVYDVVGKLQELALTGEKQAQRKLDEFEAAHESKDYKSANRLEDEVIKWAADTFELLTPLEAMDIERLHDDRHRCAHPALLALNEPYRPTAELARTHLRNAAEHLLHREPVQGRAAKQALDDAVRSAYFPTDPRKARRYLEGSSPLKSARELLVRDFVVGLATDLVIQMRPADERARQLAALQATVEIRRATAEAALRAKLPTIVAKTRDADWGRLLDLAAALPFLWEAMGEAERMKAEAFVQIGNVTSRRVELDRVDEKIHDMEWSVIADMPVSQAELAALRDRRDELLRKEALDPATFNAHPDLLLATALRIPDLRGAARSRIEHLENDALADQIGRSPHPAYVPTAIERIRDAGSFREGEFVVEALLVPLAEAMSAEETVAAVCAIRSNEEVYDAFGVRDHLDELYEVLPGGDGVADAWAELGLFLAGRPSPRSVQMARRLSEKLRARHVEAADRVASALPERKGQP